MNTNTSNLLAVALTACLTVKGETQAHTNAIGEIKSNTSKALREYVIAASEEMDAANVVASFVGHAAAFAELNPDTPPLNSGYVTSVRGWAKMTADGMDINTAGKDGSPVDMKAAQDYVASNEVKRLNAAKKAFNDAVKLQTKGLTKLQQAEWYEAQAAILNNAESRKLETETETETAETLPQVVNA